MFYPQSTCPWMVYIFLLSLPVWLFSRLFSKAASPPIVFTPALWCSFHLTIGFVYFYKVSFQHLGLLAKTWGLRPFLKGCSFWSSLLDIFWRRLQICQQNISLANLCAIYWDFSFRSIFLAVSSLVVRLLDMSELDSLLRDPLGYWGSLWWFNVAKTFQINCFLTASGVLESLLPDLFFTRIMTDKV